MIIQNRLKNASEVKSRAETGFAEGKMQDLKELLQKCPEKGQTFPKVAQNRNFAGSGVYSFIFCWRCLKMNQKGRKSGGVRKDIREARIRKNLDLSIKVDVNDATVNKVVSFDRLPVGSYLVI